MKTVSILTVRITELPLKGLFVVIRLLANGRFNFPVVNDR